MLSRILSARGRAARGARLSLKPQAQAPEDTPHPLALAGAQGDLADALDAEDDATVESIKDQLATYVQVGAPVHVACMACVSGGWL